LCLPYGAPEIRLDLIAANPQFIIGRILERRQSGFTLLVEASGRKIRPVSSRLSELNAARIIHLWQKKSISQATFAVRQIYIRLKNLQSEKNPITTYAIS